MAKLVDATGLGPVGGNTVGVRVPPSAPNIIIITKMTLEETQLQVKQMTNQIEGMKRLKVPDYLLNSAERYLECLLDDIANGRYTKE